MTSPFTTHAATPYPTKPNAISLYPDSSHIFLTILSVPLGLWQMKSVSYVYVSITSFQVTKDDYYNFGLTEEFVVQSQAQE